MITIEGRLERITYRNEDNYYTVARFKTAQAEVTITGNMAGVSSGQSLKITGQWTTHPRYGQQFKVHSYQITLPSHVDGIRTYLGSGLIKGVGRVMANRIVDTFEKDTFEVLDNVPERLLEVSGIGEKKARAIIDAWNEHHQIRRLMEFLQNVGVNASYCGEIFKRYGNEAFHVLEDDPYRLAEDLPGVGFSIADAVAMKQGGAEDSPDRLRACVHHLLWQHAGEGHVFAMKNNLVKRLRHALRLDENSCDDVIRELAERNELVIETIDGLFEEYSGDDSFTGDDRAVYSAALYMAEAGLAARLKAMLTVPVRTVALDTERICEEVFRKLAVKPSGEQLEALEGVLSHRVVIVTGGPGTGKTTLIRSINAVFEALGKQSILAAPTGRAARRLAEVAGKESKTIHRLLGYNFKENFFDKNEDNPLEADVVIVDETSMIDIQLMYNLVKAVPVYSRLVLVGDAFQLPSVGPGNVLSDMIRSEAIPVYQLNAIFRQALSSPIVAAAHSIRDGQMPEPASFAADEWDMDDGSEFFFIEENQPERILSIVLDLCTKTVPRRFSFDPAAEIQVLTPMHKGVVGTVNMNVALQSALNPKGESASTPGGAFRVGDKAMHLINNYEKDVFNGDIGIVNGIDPVDKKLFIDYSGRIVNYDFDEARELSLAYAVTIHKSQGSEYPAVIIVLSTHHYIMLQRNLLYTAITRGKQLVILVGSRRALEIAVANDKPRQRLSALAYRLS